MGQGARLVIRVPYLQYYLITYRRTLSELLVGSLLVGLVNLSKTQ